MSKQSGVSLLELMLVLCIIGVLLVAALSRHQRYRTTVDTEQVKKSVTLLQQGLTDYFFTKCKLAAPDPALERSTAEDFLKKWNNPDWNSAQLVLANPFGSPFEVEITNGRDSNIKQFWLKVYAKLDKVDQSAMPTFREMLNASGCVDSEGKEEPSCTSKILVWQKLPWYSTSGTSSDLWILAGSLQRNDQQAAGVCNGVIKQ